jgi:ERF superfamily.
MTEPDSPKDIDAVLLALQTANPILAKDKQAHQSKYADLVQINEVVLEQLNAWGTIWVCRPTLEDGVFGLHYSLRHIESGKEITGVWPLPTGDSQKMGSAVTYGRRYALLAVTGLVSEEDHVDDDGKASSEDKPRATRTVKRANGPAPEDTEADRAKRAFTRLHILWTELGMGRDAALIWADEQLNRQTPLASSKDLTAAEVDTLVKAADTLKKEREKG